MLTAEDDCLCHIKWNYFQENIGLNFSRLRNSEILTDLTFACEGMTISAHKLVLFACSPYFEEILKNDRGHSTFHMKDTSFEVLKLILEFVYFGEVKVCTEMLADFMKTAESLKIRGLTQSTEDSKEDYNMDQSLNNVDLINGTIENGIISNQDIKMETPSKIKNKRSSSGKIKVTLKFYIFF